MALAAWISLGFLAVAAGGSATLAAVRGVRTYRAFRSFSDAASGALEAVLQRAATAEDHARSATGAGERLAAATGRLQDSLAGLAVLRAAAAEARAGLTFSLPKK